MGDRIANLLCVDAPYSEKTHSGHAGGKITADRAAGFNVDTPEGRYAKKVASGLKERRDISYSHWTKQHVSAFMDVWRLRVDGWFCSLTDHVLAPDWAGYFEAYGLYTFSPLPWVEIGSRVRMTGDGPSGWTCQLVVARPRTRKFSKWGTLPGAYIMPGENHQNRPTRIMGAKSITGMCELIGDYSRPGELVVDPCVGGGTTALACRMTGRRFIGIERDAETAKLAISALEYGSRRVMDMRQVDAFL
jgi:DNA modification methylase